MMMMMMMMMSRFIKRSLGFYDNIAYMYFKIPQKRTYFVQENKR